jgi:hypothetical protein
MQKEPIRIICESCGIKDVWGFRIRFLFLSILTVGIMAVLYLMLFAFRKILFKHIN